MQPSINAAWSQPPGYNTIPNTYDTAAEQPVFTIAGHDANRPLPRPQSQPEVSSPGDQVFGGIEGVNKALAEHHAKVVAAEESQRYTPEGIAAMRAEFAQSNEAKRLEDYQQDADQLVAVAQAHVDEIRNGLVQPGDSAQELRNTRFWDQAKTTLSSADRGKVIAAARDLINNGSPAQVGVLAEHLMPHLEANGVPADWVPGELARAVPELGEAEAALREAERDRAALNFTIGTVRRAVDSGRPAVKLVSPKEIRNK